MKKLSLFTIFALSLFSSFAKDDIPNIILFLTDDQTRNSTGVYGNKQVKTPNMDKLANNGTIFANNYATTTICMASRASIMTGMFEYKTGCNFDIGPLPREKFEKSYPILLREAGYYTGFAGKFGFAVVDSADEIDPDYHSYGRLPEKGSFDWWAGGPAQTEYNTAKNKYIAKYAKQYPHSSRAYGAACSDFIREAKASGKPFCLSMSFKAPHSPSSPDPFFNNVYKGTVWDIPTNFGRQNAKHLPIQAKLGRQNLNEGTSSEAKFQAFMTKYNQLIHGVDYAIGMIMETLEKEGLADNTIIMLTSDNGYSCYAHGYGDKVLPYEEASKTPLIIYDPRAKKTDTIWRNAVSGNIDIAPTILDYAGVKAPENMDGKSLRGVVENPETRVRKELPLIQVWGSLPTTAFTVVTEDYKYIYWPYADKINAAEELYDLKKDKYELVNEISNPEYKPVLDEMKAYYAENFKAWQAAHKIRESHNAFAIIFDQNKEWSEKAAVIPDSLKKSVHSYWGLLKKIGYKGDPTDYEAIINFAENKTDKGATTKASKTTKKIKKSKK